MGSVRSRTIPFVSKAGFEGLVDVLEAGEIYPDRPETRWTTADILISNIQI